MCLSNCIAHIVGFLLKLIRISIEFVSLFFECADPLFQLGQRMGCSLKFTIQHFQRLSLINCEDIGIGFPVAESGRS
jgi:hypothetical protein